MTNKLPCTLSPDLSGGRSHGGGVTGKKAAKLVTLVSVKLLDIFKETPGQLSTMILAKHVF